MDILTQFISQGLLGSLFLLTLWCEISNKYKDCLSAILFRLLVMLSSVIIFFKIYEVIPEYGFIDQTLIIFLIGLITYLIITKILPQQRKGEIKC